MIRYVSVLSCVVLLFLCLPAPAAWPPAIRLTDGPNENINPDIFVVDQPVPWDSLILVWQRSRPGGWDIYSRHNGGGSTWSTPQLVSSLPDSNLIPSVAACNPIRYCVWVNCHGDSQNILCSRWTNGAWASPVNLTMDTFPNAEPTVRCTWYYDSVAVVWASLRNGHWNLYSRFYDGTAWSPVIPVVQDSGNNRLPHVDSYRDRNNHQHLFLAWQSDMDGNWNIMVSRFEGGSWTTPQRATRGVQTDVQPATVKGFSETYMGEIDVVWASDSLGNYEIFGTQIDSLTARERFTTHDSSDSEPSSLNHTFFSGQKALRHPVLTAWMSRRDGNANIYAELNPLSGQQSERVDSSLSEDRHPTVAAILYETNIYEWVIWQSNRDGNWNLYGSYQIISSGGVESGNSGIVSKDETKMLRPVPFHPPGSLTLFLPTVQPNLSLKFYDIRGRVVGSRLAQKKAIGRYELSWDGRNQQGHDLPSGLYFLKPEGTSALFRIVLLR
jgi:hypothetical protein